VLVTKDFVFAHVPKTGGTWLSHELKDLGLSNSYYDHYPWRKLTRAEKERPAIAFVRNPFDWYVSYWHFMRADEGHHWYHDFFPEDFEGFVRKACTVPVPHDPDGMMKGRGVDWHTTLFNWVVGPSPYQVEIRRFENLRQEFVDFCDRHGIRLSEEHLERIRNAPPVNATERGRYREYYSEDLIRLVRERNSLLAQYGYEF
jgi:hypothetical protein